MKNKTLRDNLIKIIEDAILTACKGGIMRDIAKSRADQILKLAEREIALKMRQVCRFEEKMREGRENKFRKNLITKIKESEKMIDEYRGNNLEVDKAYPVVKKVYKEVIKLIKE